MQSNDLPALRRFCHKVAGALLVIFLGCVGLLVFARPIPLGVMVFLSVIGVVLILGQDSIAKRLDAYLSKNLRYSCFHTAVIFGVLFIGLGTYYIEEVTGDITVLAALAAYSLSLLLDTLYALRSINRHADAATPDPERKPD